MFDIHKVLDLKKTFRPFFFKKNQRFTLHSSINYDDEKDPFRRRKGKAYMV